MAVKMLCFILYFNTECLSASESQSRKGYLKGYLLPFRKYENSWTRMPNAF